MLTKVFVTLRVLKTRRQRTGAGYGVCHADYATHGLMLGDSSVLASKSVVMV